MTDAGHPCDAAGEAIAVREAALRLGDGGIIRVDGGFYLDAAAGLRTAKCLRYQEAEIRSLETAAPLPPGVAVAGAVLLVITFLVAKALP